MLETRRESLVQVQFSLLLRKLIWYHHLSQAFEKLSLGIGNVSFSALSVQCLEETIRLILYRSLLIRGEASGAGLIKGSQSGRLGAIEVWRPAEIGWRFLLSPSLSSFALPWHKPGQVLDPSGEHSFELWHFRFNQHQSAQISIN